VERFVRQFRVQRVLVGIAIHGDSLHAQFLGSANHTTRNLTTIGNHYLVDFASGVSESCAVKRENIVRIWRTFRLQRKE
jgi:hypothetical protein